MSVFYSHTPKTKNDRLPLLVLVFLMSSCVAGIIFFFNSFNHLNNWKINKWCISNSVYNEAFNNGVGCGVDALMFFVKQGKKEIDINEVYNKAQEIRKNREKDKEKL